MHAPPSGSRASGLPSVSRIPGTRQTYQRVGNSPGLSIRRSRHRSSPRPRQRRRNSASLHVKNTENHSGGFRVSNALSVSRIPGTRQTYQRVGESPGLNIRRFRHRSSPRPRQGRRSTASLHVKNTENHSGRSRASNALSVSRIPGTRQTYQRVGKSPGLSIRRSRHRSSPRPRQGRRSSASLHVKNPP